MFPEADRIRAEFLSAVADSYDPQQRRAPIVSGDGPIRGAAHKVGELNPPVGWIEKAEFDGLTLWGLVVDAGGRLVEKMKEGFLRGSVAIWNSLPEADGGPYLRHFALLGAEQAGTTNLPDIEKFFAGMETADEATARSLQAAPYITRTAPGDPEQEGNMDSEKLEQLLGKVERSLDQVTSGQAELKTTIETQRSTIEGLETKLKELESKQASSVEAAAEMARKARESQMRSAVEKLSAAGKVLPAEVDEEIAILMSRSDADAQKRLEVLEGRAAVQFGPRKVSVAETGRVESDFVSMRDLTHPNAGQNEAGNALVTRALAEAKGDPKEFRRIVYALDGQADIH